MIKNILKSFIIIGCLYTVVYGSITLAKINVLKPNTKVIYKNEVISDNVLIYNNESYIPIREFADLVNKDIVYSKDYIQINDNIRDSKRYIADVLVSEVGRDYIKVVKDYDGYIHKDKPLTILLGLEVDNLDSLRVGQIVHIEKDLTTEDLTAKKVIIDHMLFEL